jgi:glutamine synthetase
MPGEKEAYKKKEFTVGVGDKTASIMIPALTAASNRGEIEDRRPPSDMDPYLVSALLADTIISEEGENKIVTLFKQFKEKKEAKVDKYLEQMEEDISKH